MMFINKRYNATNNHYKTKNKNLASTSLCSVYFLCLKMIKIGGVDNLI